MHGEFFSYRAERAVNGEVGPSGNGYLGGQVGEDADGNIWLYGRPRKGESRADWIKRGVIAALDSTPVTTRTVTDGQGFIIGHQRSPWWRFSCYDVSVRDGYERGRYEVWVHRYVVDLTKH